MRLIVHHVPARMTYDFHIVEDRAGRLWGQTQQGEWVEVDWGAEAPITFQLPETLVPSLLSQLGMPLSDQNLLEALRYERGRVDRVIDKYLNS